MAITAQERSDLIELAVLMFNAAPGATYLSELASIYESTGRNLAVVANILAGTPAYQQLNPNFQTAEEFATAFLTPLGLEANTTAREFVVARLNAGASKGQVAFEAMVALDAYTGDDAAIVTAKAEVANKVEVSEYYSVTKAVAQTNLGTLQQVLASVTSDDATVEVAPTPDFFRWSAASMWTPGPFESKPSRAMYYLTDVDPKWESDRSVPRSIALAEISRKLGVSTDVLLYGRSVVSHAGADGDFTTGDDND